MFDPDDTQIRGSDGNSDIAEKQRRLRDAYVNSRLKKIQEEGGQVMPKELEDRISKVTDEALKKALNENLKRKVGQLSESSSLPANFKYGDGLVNDGNSIESNFNEEDEEGSMNNEANDNEHENGEKNDKSSTNKPSEDSKKTNQNQNSSLGEGGSSFGRQGSNFMPGVKTDNPPGGMPGVGLNKVMGDTGKNNELSSPLNNQLGNNLGNKVNSGGLSGLNQSFGQQGGNMPLGAGGSSFGRQGSNFMPGVKTGTGVPEDVSKGVGVNKVLGGSGNMGGQGTPPDNPKQMLNSVLDGNVGGKGNNPASDLTKGVADQFGVNKKAASLLFWIYIIAGTLLAITVFGIPLGLALVTLLLVRPRWAYRLVIWIVNIFTGGAAGKYASFAIDPSKIKLKTWHRFALAGYDLVVVTLLLFALGMMVVLTCDQALGSTGRRFIAEGALLGLRLYDWGTGGSTSNAFSAFLDVCDAISNGIK